MGDLLISSTEDPASAKQRLLDVLGAWLSDAIPRHQSEPWHGVHDEGTFLTSWREYYLHTHDDRVKKLAFALFDHAETWMTKHFVNGYYPLHEVHHGIEHFIIFLAWLYELDPTYPGLAARFQGAAQHLAKSNPKSHPWFDFQRNRFTSLYLGSKKTKPKLNLNIVEHFRFLRLACYGLATSPVSSPLRAPLNQVLNSYTDEWTERILTSDLIPVYLDSGKATETGFQKALQSFIGAAPREMTPITRSEIHIANGTPDFFMDRYVATQKRAYLDVVQKILAPLTDQLLSPYAHPVGDLLWRAHRLGLNLDIPSILDSCHNLYDQIVDQPLHVSLNLDVKWGTTGYKGTVGFRKDMPELVITNSHEERVILPSPATWGLCYRITKDPRYLQVGLSLALAVFQAGQPLFKDDREHGCGSRALHSICVGHGRNWGAGFVSTILRAALNDDCFAISLPHSS